jgi:glycosyltransferase involved in cell wall biosynthesis
VVSGARGDGVAALKVSVCVPTYNRAGYLAQALGTLRAQTFDDFELVVVDNCSTDGTAEFVGSQRDPRLRYHRNERNLGSRGNWNRCLDLAQGEFVAICHDDDLYAPDFLRRGVNVLDAHPRVAFVHTAARVIDPAGRPLRTYRAHRGDVVWPGTEVFLRFLAHSHDVVMSTVIARRACYDAVDRFTTEFLCADMEMWLRLCLQGDVAYIATPLVSYRTHAESASLTMDPARWCRENEQIVRRAIGWARGSIGGIEAREEEFVEATRRLWARRTLREALFAASCGQRETAAAYLAVSRELGRRGPGAWEAGLASVLVGPLGAPLLRAARETRRRLRRVT